MAVVLGLFAMFRPEYGPATELSKAMSMILGGSDSSPAALIALGTGLVGVSSNQQAARKAADADKQAVIAKVERVGEKI